MVKSFNIVRANSLIFNKAAQNLTHTLFQQLYAMDYDAKSVQNLLKDVQNDPHLQTTDDTTVMWDELYPVTHQPMLPNVRKVKNSLRNALSLMTYIHQ